MRTAKLLVGPVRFVIASHSFSDMLSIPPKYVKISIRVIFVIWRKSTRKQMTIPFLCMQRCFQNQDLIFSNVFLTLGKISDFTQVPFLKNPENLWYVCDFLFIFFDCDGRKFMFQFRIQLEFLIEIHS